MGKVTVYLFFKIFLTKLEESNTNEIENLNDTLPRFLS